MDERPDPCAARLGALRATFVSGRTRDAAWRRRQLRGLQRLMLEREAELAAALREDLHKPLQEAWITELSWVHGEAG